MKFTSEAERMQHPQASLIPLNLWDGSFFEQELPDYLFPLMSEPDEQKVLDQIRMLGLSDQLHCERTWLAIVCSHLEARDTILYEMAVALEISDALVFATAASLGKLSLIELLRIAKKETGLWQQIISANHFDAWKLAARNGALHIVQYFVENVSEEALYPMIAADEFAAYSFAAENGFLQIMLYLEKKVANALEDMVVADNFYAFRWAVTNGHIDVVKHLFEKSGNFLQEMIASDEFSCLWQAAQGGYFDIFCLALKAIKKPFASEVNDSLCCAFRAAAQNGHLGILQHIVSEQPEGILMDAYSGALYSAAENGHLPILQYLSTKAPNQFHNMIASDGYIVFKRAVDNNHCEVAYYLLSFSSVFACVEQHDREYGARYTRPYVQVTLQNLRMAKEQQQESIFDCEEEAARYLLHILRYLIVCNEPAVRDDIIFLLDIPGVKKLANGSVTSSQPNELIRLALSKGNRMAAEALLDIPAVDSLAAAHNYYREELHSAFDLRALALDRESSMTALSLGEQNRLQRAIEYYLPAFAQEANDKEVENKKEHMLALHIQELRDHLAQLYQKSPATIVAGVRGVIELPLLWDAFQQQAEGMSESEYADALRAYYQNTCHTAWRYLAKPNFWMHPDASYCCNSSDNPQQKWSAFEGYQLLICTVYHAARDTMMPCSAGHTPESRLEHFINELALIARSHNWDSTRIKCDKNGKEQVDNAKIPIKEEYDDMEGDKPSCFSGTKRRLFQAVQGHPLFVFLTEDKVIQEINSFVREQFQMSIASQNLQVIRRAWNKCTDLISLDEAEWYALKQMDISETQQTVFINFMNKKYGKEFSNDPLFTRIIRKAFALPNEKDTHFLKFSYLQIEQLLKGSTSPGNNFHSFYNAKNSGESDEPVNEYVDEKHANIS